MCWVTSFLNNQLTEMLNMLREEYGETIVKKMTISIMKKMYITTEIKLLTPDQDYDFKEICLERIKIQYYSRREYSAGESVSYLRSRQGQCHIPRLHREQWPH